MTAVWFLAWVGSSTILSVLLASVWIRLRDNFRRDGIDLDEMDQPAIYHTDAALDEQAARDIRNALRDLARREGRSSPL